MSVDSLFAAVQEECLPGIWSKGVALTRAEGAVILDAERGGELQLRVTVPGKAVSPKVTLWVEDEDSFCNCGGKVEPCEHIAAAVIALKAGRLARPAADAAPRNAARLVYCLGRDGDRLTLERRLLIPGPDGSTREEPLRESLVAYVGGVRGGRIAAPPPAVSQDDFAADQALAGHLRGPLERAALPLLFKALAELAGSLRLEGLPAGVTISSKPLRMRAELVPEGPGAEGQRPQSQWAVRLRRVQDPEVVEIFSNGAALRAGELRAIEDPGLTAEQREWLRGEGTLFPAARLAELAQSVLPALEERIEVDRARVRLPELRKLAPRIVLTQEERPGETLAVLPTLVYGDPPIAYVQDDRLELIAKDVVPARDPAAEKALRLRLHQELHLQLGQVTEFRGVQAVDFQRRAQGWETVGAAKQKFRAEAALRPEIRSADGRTFEVAFPVAGAAPGGVAPGHAPGGAFADPARVWQAWERREPLVPLSDGTWARLPVDWLERHADALRRLLALRDRSPGKRLPAYALPELAELAESTPDASGADALTRLRRQLLEPEAIGEKPLPADLTATLRHYQESGVRWLRLLRELGAGALLADDMGLGKSLQALCAIRGRTLIVCPTSVLSAWQEQLARFRPALRVAVYHGSGRKLERHADVTLTTYSLLRLDQALLTMEEWETLVVDEAQYLKNSASQVAQAARQLKAAWRIGLSGTPVENRLEDLWSLMELLNPGLLGDRERFAREFASPMARGDAEAAARLRARIRPFLLRRLKRDVAPELPERTEVTLQCELSREERDLYRQVHAVTRKDVLARLESGQSPLQALEALLRLRQVCCHPGLVPGGGEPESSAKITLLVESLTASIEAGHRSLVFSQWTSFLDRIEPHLAQAGIAFLRLDGSTRDREAVVRAFQADDGPPVLLISLRAGGTGLTLTAADHVLLLDPWWNPAVEDQAADRAHRIGQTQKVLVQRLVARDTVEEKILLLQRRKQAMADAALGSGTGAPPITREDILELLTGTG